MSPRPSLRAVAIVALLLCLWGAAACGEDAPRHDDVQPQAKTEGRVIARVNGEPLTLAELQASLDAQPAFIRRSLTGRTALLRYFGDLVRFTLLTQEARRRGLGADPMVQLVVKQALADRWLAEQTAQPDLSDVSLAELDARVAAAPERFASPDLVTVVQLFVRDPRRAATLSLAYQLCTAARTLTVEERARIVRRLARLSDSRNAESTLGPLSAADADAVLPAAVLQAALQAPEVGRLLPPVPVQGGVYLLLVESREEGKPLSTQEARAQARQALAAERQEAAIRGLTRALVETAELAVSDPDDEAALRLLRSSAPAGPSGSPSGGGLVDTTGQE